MSVTLLQNLPEFLEADDSGFVHFRGHRIGLHEIARRYRDGFSAEMLAEHFPTLSLSLIHKAIAFYLDNMPLIDAYVAEHDAGMQRQYDAAPKVPDPAELRRRMEAKRRREAAAKTAG